MKTLRSLICVSAAILASAWSVHATPYASEVTNNNGTIQFYLNEAIVPANGDSVIVTFEDNSTLSLTASAVVGVNSFTLLQGVTTHTSYSIAVKKIGAGSPQQISTDSSSFPSYWTTPRGLDVYTNPKNSRFGRVYVANSGAGVEGRGLYILNSDLSSEAGGTTGIQSSVFAGSGTSGPYRIGIGAGDGNIYVGDLSSADANVYQFDPDFANPAVPVLADTGNTAGQAAGIHGEIIGAPRTTGSTAGGNLVLWTTDYVMPVDADGATTTLGYNTAAGDFNNINQYIINGASFPWAGQPNLAINAQVPSIATLVEEVDIGSKTGHIYLGNFRANYVIPDLEVFDPTGMTLLWDSTTADGGTVGSGPDFFNPAMTAYSTYVNGTTPTGTGTAIAAGTVAPYSMRVSPDEKFVACGLVNNPIYIMNLNNGIPDPTTLQVIPNYPNTTGYENLRGITWDAADNVYTISSGMHYLRVYSLGLTTIAVTANDSTGQNGTFSLSSPSISASVAATTPQAYQANNSVNGGPGAAVVPAQFTISLNAAQTGAIPVTFTLGGTATNVVNYTVTTSASVSQLSTSPYSITFPAGATTETVTITPTAFPGSGPSLSVILSLNSGTAYSAVSPSVATAHIANSGQQFLFVGPITYPTMYRGTPNDYVAFQIIRYGDTNVSQYTIPATAFTYTGTAHEGTDYTSPIPAINVNPGDTFETATNGGPQLNGTYPFTYVGNESVIVTMSAAPGYSMGSSTTATMTLLDNADPPENNPIWSDPLTSATDTGWNLAFGSVGVGTAANPVVTFIPNYNQSTSPDNTDQAHDYEVEFGAVLASDGLIGANPPSGATTALHVTVNKLAGTSYTGETGNGTTGGVSLYPAGPTGTPMSFSNNYALRFSELTYEDTGSSATEFTDWGINHIGTNANWWAGNYTGGAGNTNIDGVWNSLTCDQGGASFGDVLAFTSTNVPNTGWVNLASLPWGNYSAVFKHPPYNSSGTGAFSEGYGNTASLWNDVELKQFNNVITLTINKSVIWTYTNTTGHWQSGDIMLGYVDPFDSIGTYGEAYFSNVRVISLAGPTITSVSVSGGNVVIKFTSPDADAVASSFTVESSTNLKTGYAPVSPAATITQSGATFTAVTPYSATTATKFFLIKQTNLVQ
jgi:hypothetical protein